MANHYFTGDVDVQGIGLNPFKDSSSKKVQTGNAATISANPTQDLPMEDDNIMEVDTLENNDDLEDDNNDLEDNEDVNLEDDDDLEDNDVGNDDLEDNDNDVEDDIVESFDATDDGGKIEALEMDEFENEILEETYYSDSIIY